MKTCTKCQVAKLLEAFCKHRISPDGHYPKCRDCRRIEHQAYVADPAVKARLATKAKARYADPKIKARQKAQTAVRLSDPVAREKHLECMRRIHRRNMQDPEYRQRRSDDTLLRRFGLTRADRETMLASQGGRCAVCRTDDPPGEHANRRWHIDHCHKTRRVRAILCANCNNALGFLRESVTTAEAMVEYIRRVCVA